jgi:hypothetical protein
VAVWNYIHDGKAQVHANLVSSKRWIEKDEGRLLEEWREVNDSIRPLCRLANGRTRRRPRSPSVQGVPIASGGAEGASVVILIAVSGAVVAATMSWLPDTETPTHFIGEESVEAIISPA